MVPRSNPLPKVNAYVGSVIYLRYLFQRSGVLSRDCVFLSELEKKKKGSTLQGDTAPRSPHDTKYQKLVNTDFRPYC